MASMNNLEYIMQIYQNYPFPGSERRKVSMQDIHKVIDKSSYALVTLSMKIGSDEQPDQLSL